MRIFKRFLNSFDRTVIGFMKRAEDPFARFALFTVFFWFGILKVLIVSPANPLVDSLLHATLPFISFGQFIVLFGWYEMAIGVTFLIPRLERLAIALLAVHMTTTLMPLVLLREMTWQGFLVPTLEGQYIIKNLVIIALAMGIAARLTPFRLKGAE